MHRDPFAPSSCWIAALLPSAALALASLSACHSTPVEEAQAASAFESVRRVLQHPRCQNCHVPGDAPLQSDRSVPHVQSIVRGPDGKGAPGLPCATCHGSANLPASYGAQSPPGAPGWQLPPPETKMVFIGLSSAELCRGLKDRRANGGKDLAALVEHVSRDPLVLWGWAPGGGRAPVSVPHAQFVADFERWVRAGAPCPPPR